MTVFRNEQEGLRYSISSNNSAIKYFTQQLEEMPFYGDFGTDGAIRSGYEEIIKSIKLDSRGMRKRIKELDSEDEENHY